MTEETAPRLALKTSLTITFTGWSQAGKSEQARRVFNACDDSPATRDAFLEGGPSEQYPFRPALVISCEPSTAVTMADVLVHPDCDFMTIENLEEFLVALEQVDLGHGGTDEQVGEPYRMVFFDGFTALCEGAKGDARAVARAEGSGPTMSGHAVENDERKISAAANRLARDALRAWARVQAKHPGLLLLSSAHADEKWIPKPGAKQGERIQIGEQVDLPPKSRKWLLNGANLIIYLGRQLPEVESLEALEDLAPDDPSMVPSYYALTRPVRVGGMEYDLIKWQEGAITVPILWRDPDLGAALLASPLRAR